MRLGHHRFMLADYLVDQNLRPQATERYRQAMDAFETAAQLAPDDHRALGKLAWHLALIDDPAIRNPARAVVLARKAVELAPNYCELWDTLGVACYHAGNWSEAVTALEKGFALLEERINPAYPIIHIPSEHPDKAKSKCYLALAYNRLGNVEKARMWYDQVVQWMDKNGPQDEELRRLHAEAAELLGIRQQPPVQDKEAAPRRTGET
jgi:tetratricopeptide (TPR) repeat protein